MFLQIVINGLILASSYALVAVGLTLIFGVMRMVNFAGGQSVMIGAYVAFTAAPITGYLPAIVLAMLVNAGLGVVLERVAFRPFRGVELNGLIASMGMAIILINVAELVWGTVPRTFDTPFTRLSVLIGAVGVSVQRLLVIASSGGLLAGLWWLVQYSSLGRQFRAVAEDPEIAAAMGIDPDRISRAAVVLGSSLAAAAGAVAGPVTLLSPDMGQSELLNAFAVIILGGFGNVSGTMLAAVVIGLVQSAAAVYVSNAYSNSIAFGLLVATLICFPRGLVPERAEENV